MVRRTGTRPGATPLAQDEELARIGPVLAELARTLDVAISIDTYKAGVAAKAVDLGAVVVNDRYGEILKNASVITPSTPSQMFRARSCVCLAMSRASAVVKSQK